MKQDYIIVGAGSAGCVLANRLSADGKHKVTLLEAGGDDRYQFWVQMPMGYGKTYYQKSVNWMYETVPQAGLNNRSSYWPRGKVLGGSGSINAMVYIRGHRKDYDDWAAAGNPGWLSRSVLYAMHSYIFNDAGCQLAVMQVSEINKTMNRIARAYGYRDHTIPRLRGPKEAEIIWTLTDDDWRKSRFHRS